jgi:hypothetical protein
MAIKALNSVGGFSVGEVPVTIVYANGDITTLNLSANANVLFNGPNVTLGQVANLHILGGTNGQVLQTDGTGNLSFTTISQAGLTNGTSNINVLENGNILLSSAGNANVLVVTGSGANVNGYVNLTGNLTSGNASLGNLATANYFTGTLTTNAQPNITSVGTLTSLDITGNLTSGNANLGNLATANYIGGTLTTASQPNITSVGTLANLSVTGNLTSGNASLGNLAIANFINVSSNLNVTDTANVGNLRTDNLLYANGQPWDLQEAAGANYQIQYNDNNDFGASANFTYNDSTQQLTLSGNANITNTLKTYQEQLTSVPSQQIIYANGSSYLVGSANYTFDDSTNNLSLNGNVLLGGSGQNQLVSLSNTALEIRGGWNNATSASASLVAGDYANSANWGKISILGNVSGNATAYIEANATNFQPAGGGANIVKINTLSTAATSTTTGALQVTGGAGITGNAYIGGNLSVDGNIANANNISVTNQLSAVTGNFSGNISSGNANLGNLVTANYLSGTLTTAAQPNITSVGTLANLSVTGNIGTGNLSATGQISATGNITGGNIISDGAVIGNIDVGNLDVSGNILVESLTSNANITANGSFVSDNVYSRTGNLNLYSTGTNTSIVLNPTGTGTVDATDFRISNVATPTFADDAATKQYVDNAVSSGIQIHTPVRLEANSAISGTYAQGGTTPTITTITGQTTLTTSSNHGLSVNDMIVFDSTGSGLVAGTAYFVYSTPALDQITLSASYGGVQITSLTNGTGLTITSRANSGVGATLTNSGANARLVIDGVEVNNSDRLLIYSQANAAHNGVYVVTAQGAPDSPGPGEVWVLTRATDQNKYAPQTTTNMGAGDYFYVQQGDSGAGESYVLTDPTGPIIIGTTAVTYTQFSASQVYSAGTGLTLDGTTFSIANTAVTAGNYGNGDRVVAFTVNSQGQLTAATDTVITANAANLSGTSLNANIVSSNLTSVGTLANLDVTGNIIAGNVYANSGTIGAQYLTGTLTTAAQPNVTSVGTLANLDVTGNITAANIIGNIYGNVTGNLEAPGSNTQVLFNDSNTIGAVAGLTFDKTSNLLTLSGNANVGGILTDNYYYSNGAPVDFEQPAGSNTQLQFNDNNSFGASANLTFDSANNVLTVNGTSNLANIQTDKIDVGNTIITNGGTTTVSTSANQTIATFKITSTDITGVEFFVKGIDSSGAKYSVAKVVAVTNGSNVDYSTFATINVNGTTGSLSVNLVTSGGNSNIELQVTPSSSNSTVWTTQYRLI